MKYFQLLSGIVAVGAACVPPYVALNLVCLVLGVINLMAFAAKRR